MDKRLFFIFLILLLSSAKVFSEEETITVKQFVETACEKDTVFQEILIKQLNLKYQKALLLPAGDIVFDVESNYNFFFDPAEEESDYSVSLTKLFPFTATEITAEYSTAVKTSTRGVASGFSFTVSQALAENAFGKDTKLLDDIVGIEVDVAKHQIIEAYEDYLASIIQLYYDWYASYENFKTAQNSYNESLKLLDNIKERQKSKIALDIDVNKINLQVINKKEKLISLEQVYKEYSNLAQQAIRHKEDKTLIPTDSSLYMNLILDFNGDYKKFKEDSRTSKILKLLENKSSLEVDRYANQILPSIDLLAGFSIEGVGHNLKSDEKKAFVGVSIDWPFESSYEKALKAAAENDFKAVKLSSQSTDAKLYTTLKNVYLQIQQEYELLRLADEKINLAKDIVKDETENYSLARTTLNDLIDEINRLEDNKFNKITHQVKLKKLVVEWLRLNDSLVKKEAKPVF